MKTTPTRIPLLLIQIPAVDPASGPTPPQNPTALRRLTVKWSGVVDTGIWTGGALVGRAPKLQALQLSYSPQIPRFLPRRCTILSEGPARFLAHRRCVLARV